MIQNVNIDDCTVTAELHGNMYEAIYGNSGVFNYGSALNYEIVSNNLINIKDGVFVNQGRFGRIAYGTTEGVTIDNGINGVNRKDLIVIRFSTDGLKESQQVQVLKGLNDGEAPKPTIGNINKGDLVADLPLYEVQLTGLNITKVVPLFKTLVPSYVNFDSLFGVTKKITIQPSEWIDGVYTFRDPLITKTPRETTQEFFVMQKKKGESNPELDEMNNVIYKASISGDLEQINGECYLYCKGEVPKVPITIMVTIKGW